MKPEILKKVPSENLLDWLLAINIWIYGIYLTLHLFGKDFTIEWINVILGVFFAVCSVVYIYMIVFHRSTLDPKDKWEIATLPILNIIFILQYLVW